jgi:uroporphyrinogen decarboxylase
MASTLSPRENFRRMMTGQPYEWTPMDISATAPVLDEIEKRLGTRDPSLAFGLDFRTLEPRMPVNADKWRQAVTALGYDLPADADIARDGIMHISPTDESTGEAYHLQEMLHPLEGVTSVEQLESLPFTDYRAWRSEIKDELREWIDAVHAEGRVALVTLACTVFESAWYVRGMENLYMDIFDGNGIADWLLDYHMNRSIELASLAAELGADVILLGDDVGMQTGMMISVEFWREHLKGRLANVIKAIRDKQHESEQTYVMYHSDGDIRDIVGELADIGVDILNPVQPECMPVDEVIPAYQDRLVFWGMVGTQTTMPFGDAANVTACVKHLKDLAQSGARLVIAPTHVLEPDVPWSNIQALAAEI